MNSQLYFIPINHNINQDMRSSELKSVVTAGNIAWNEYGMSLMIMMMMINNLRTHMDAAPRP